MTEPTELQRRRELDALTKPGLIDYIVRLEAEVGAFDLVGGIYQGSPDGDRRFSKAEGGVEVYIKLNPTRKREGLSIWQQTGRTLGVEDE